MKFSIVKDLMIPLSDYATVSQDECLLKAIEALDKVRAKYEQRKNKSRAILVLDVNGKVVGKLSQLDVLRALEPKYKDIGEVDIISRFGFGPAIIESITENLSIFNHPLDDICKKSAKIIVKDVMYTPKKGEYVNETASLNEAIHQLVIGHHQALLVTRNDEIVGIIRLSDVFTEVSNLIKKQV